MNKAEITKRGRYVAKLANMSFDHVKTGTLVPRYYLVLPKDLVHTKDFPLRFKEPILVTYEEKDGKRTGRLIVEML